MPPLGDKMQINVFQSDNGSTIIDLGLPPTPRGAFFIKITENNLPFFVYELFDGRQYVGLITSLAAVLARAAAGASFDEEIEFLIGQARRGEKSE